MMERAGFTIATAVLMSVIGAGDIADGDLYSPDGVFLYDLNEHSAVWGRGFNMGVTSEEAALIYDECAKEAATNGKEVGFDECLMPYYEEIYWTVDNERVYPADNEA